jgi:hypothetical protein
MFLPEGDPNRPDGAQHTLFGGDYLSKPLRQRALAWLQEQATARLGKKEDQRLDQLEMFGGATPL